MTCVFHVHLLRCNNKVFVLLAPLLDVKGIGTDEEEVLHVFECGLQCLGVVITRYSECDPSVFELFAIFLS